jgi:hypothetical protein
MPQPGIHRMASTLLISTRFLFALVETNHDASQFGGMQTRKRSGALRAFLRRV